MMIVTQRVIADGVAYLEIYSKNNHYRPVLQEIDLKK